MRLSVSLDHGLSLIHHGIGRVLDLFLVSCALLEKGGARAVRVLESRLGTTGVIT